MSLFGRSVANSTPNEGGVYWLAEGNYLVEVDTVKIHEGRKNNDFFIVSGKNLESDHDERPIGTKCSWVSDIKKDATPGNIKLFLCGALGVDLADLNDEEWEKLADRAIETDNPLCGFTVRLNATSITTRAGNPFTKHVWSPAGEMTKKAEEILAGIMAQ